MSLDDRFRQSLNAAIDDVRAKLEAEFQAVLVEARSEAEEAKAAALAETKLSVESALFAVYQAEKDSLAASHQGLLSQAQESALAETQQLREEADAAVAEARAGAGKAAEDLARQREEFEAATAAHRAEFEAATAAHRVELEAAPAKLHEEHEAVLNAARADAQVAADASARALAAHAASAARLLEAARGLDGASSLTEVLDALTGAVARESGRAAMLVVKSDRLIGWRTNGFGSLDHEPRSVEASTGDGSALAAAVDTARPSVAGHGSALAPPEFAQLGADQVGVAVPLMVGGRAVAVVYADAGAQEPLPAWQATVEVLVRHAGRCLEAMTVQRAAQARSSSVRVGTPA